MANRGNHSRKKPGGAANAVKGVLVACMLLVLFAAGSTLFKSDDARSPGIAATPPVSATGGGQGDTIDATTGDNNTPPAGIVLLERGRPDGHKVLPGPLRGAQRPVPDRRGGA